MKMLEAKKIKKNFGELKVLKGVDLTVEKGETVAIIGPSGSGKSTFLRCLNCLEKIDGGSIAIEEEWMAKTVDGKVFYPADAELRKIRIKTSMVFQNFNLFPHLSVMENLILAPVTVFKADKEEARETAFGLLRKVGLEEKADSYPCELSGGQSQRVAIARALAMNPDMLCFDEPTSALDPELTGEVLNVIKDLAREHMTMIVVTHEMGFAREVADKVVFMEDGMIIDQGSPADVLVNTQNERIRAFLNKIL